MFHFPAVADNKNTSSSLLPFFSELAEGYDLPAPYGVGVNHMAIRQGIQIDSISFSGMKLGSLPVERLIEIWAGRTRQKSYTETIRLDVWMLPFMNVYGVAGRTKGHSVSDVSIRTPVFTGGAFPSGKTQDLNFRLNYKGNTYGAGVTLAGGMNNMFMSLDANYTQTRFDVLDGHINAMTLTPRVGYRFSLPETAYFPVGSLSIWVGSMYQDVQQDFRGKLSRLFLPSPALQQWLNRVNKNGDARFEIRQHLKHPWNIMTGIRYDVTRHVSLTAEAGFEARKSIFVSGEYRF
ncbi:TPA: hypothetical protein JLP25_003961 [Escherichia coli]|nr:hypothetical protein [Escherichia coli]EKR5145146.1 hypothetical protein [Escherichia coli]ELD1746206.1 hypothetical protein [Escherichia coli]ELO4849566.1 hypothetical protein [Escherichia coli]ELO5051208.1 hypothetical protein [Escherichia coli]